MADAGIPPYTYDNVTHRWRSTSTGRFISHAQAIATRDSYLASKAVYIDRLALQVAGARDAINIQQWVLGMRTQIKQAYINEYMLARGGIKNMTQADWGRIGGMLNNQYRYLNNFAQEIAAGKMTAGQIATRAKMYIDSATQAYERGHAAEMDLTLPAYPGDGSTECRTNCKCHWEIDDGEGVWECYWRLEAEAEHCEDCDQRASDWNPLVIPRINYGNKAR